MHKISSYFLRLLKNIKENELTVVAIKIMAARGQCEGSAKMHYNIVIDTSFLIETETRYLAIMAN